MRITNVIICSKNYLDVLCVVFFSIAPDCNLLEIMGLNFKKLTRETSSDKMLHDKGFNFAKHAKYERYQRRLALIFYKFLDKKIICYSQRPHSQNNKNDNTSNQQIKINQVCGNSHHDRQGLGYTTTPKVPRHKSSKHYRRYISEYHKSIDDTYAFSKAVQLQV